MLSAKDIEWCKSVRDHMPNVRRRKCLTMEVMVEQVSDQDRLLVGMRNGCQCLTAVAPNANNQAKCLLASTSN